MAKTVKTETPAAAAPKAPPGTSPIVARLFEELGKTNRRLDILLEEVRGLRTKRGKGTTASGKNIFGEEEE